jgi:hypothetical protein
VTTQLIRDIEVSLLFTLGVSIVVMRNKTHGFPFRRKDCTVSIETHCSREGAPHVDGA